MKTMFEWQKAKGKVLIARTFFCHLFSAFCLFILPVQPGFAQEQKENEVALDPSLMLSENWFNDLEKAKQHPGQVLYLDLSLQKLRAFPKEILTFKNVERLYLPYNYWPSIPDEIGILTRVKILDLSGNYYMNYLPLEGLSKLKNLELFIIKDNKLAAGEIEKVRKLLPHTKIVAE
ncbi:MAG TPA: hypothetical protein VNJ07_07005 [Chitinophagales bacterium]|nr:hypothetical protein [Chitinophagales bacterium]